MFAVIKTGGKQYKVSKDDIISVEKLLGKPGDRVEISDVLMVGGAGGALEIGAPLIKNARVIAEILEQGKGEKVIVFKKKRRHNYRRKRGHRQEITLLKVLEVSQTGSSTKVAAKNSTAGQVDNKAKSKATEKKAGSKAKTEKKAPSKASSSKKASGSAVKKASGSAVKKASGSAVNKPAKKTTTKKPVAKKAPSKRKKTTEADKD